MLTVIPYFCKTVVAFHCLFLFFLLRDYRRRMSLVAGSGTFEIDVSKSHSYIRNREAMVQNCVLCLRIADPGTYVYMWVNKSTRWPFMNVHGCLRSSICTGVDVHEWLIHGPVCRRVARRVESVRYQTYITSNTIKFYYNEICSPRIHFVLARNPNF